MRNSDPPFQGYALAYDALYHQKNYAAETQFVEEIATRFSAIPVRSILDLGCGTGGHAIPLASRGYEVTGVDMSSEMLAQARTKAGDAVASGSLSLIQGDIANIELESQFDMIICMFAVLSYQTTNQRLAQTFSAVRKHLRKGGVFLCDFWYGPAVLRDLPTAREKWVTEDARKIRRVATPVIDFNSNVVSVTYDTSFHRGDEVIQTSRETHAMRYFFLPELNLYGELNHLNLVHCSDCCKISESASEKTWTVSAVFGG